MRLEMTEEKNQLMNLISHKFDEFVINNEERIGNLASKTKHLCSSEISKNLEHNDLDRTLQSQVSSELDDILNLNSDQYHRTVDNLENHLQVLMEIIFKSLEVNQFV